MLNKTLLIFFLNFLLIITNCQKKDNKNNMMNTKLTINNEEKLIDKLIIDDSVFKKNDIDLKKYKYQNSYIEDLKIKDLINTQYREEFIKYLKEVKAEDDEFKATLVTQLLYLRMVQLSDTNAFYLLSELSKDNLVAYNGIELYSEKLTKFFIENPMFFIQQGTKYHEGALLNTINEHLDDFLVKKSFFADNLGEINLQSGQLFLFPEKENEFSEGFRKRLSEFNKEECIFSPSLYTAWQNKTVDFKDISPIFNETLISKLNTFEKNYFRQYILPILKNYIIIVNDDQKMATINDPDGFTNLRKDKSTSSEILQKIKSGEHIEILNNSGDWFLVKTKEEKEGYVHRSRIKN